MAEELRIVVSDSGGGGGGVSGGGGGRVLAAGERSPSITKLGQMPTSLMRSASSVRAIATRGAAAVGRAAGFAGMAIGAGVAAVGGAAAAGNAILGRQVSNLAGLSPELSQAVAESELSGFNDRLRRANRIGPALAGFERTRNRLGSAVSDLGTEILRVMLAFFEVVRPLIEQIAANIEGITDVLQREVPNFLEGFADNLPFWFDFIKEPLRIMSRALRRMEREIEERGQMSSFFEQFIAQLERPVEFWPQDQAEPLAGGPLIPEPL